MGWIPKTIKDILTTKGDVAVYNGSKVVRLPVGTNDQVLTADSALTEGVKWAAGGGGGGGSGRTLIDSDTLASAAASISISGIPTGHNDLLLKLWARTSDATQGSSFVMRVGNTSVDTGNNYSWVFRQWGDNNNLDQASDDDELWPNTGSGSPLTGGNADAGYFGFAQIEIIAYTDTSFHRFINFRGFRRSGSGNRRMSFGEGTWANDSDVIDIIELKPGDGSNFVAGTAWELYGV